MSTIQVLLFSILAAVIVPITVYTSVKLGTYAFFRARHLFNQEHEGDQHHGKD